MSDIYSGIERVLSKRAALSDQFKDQHQKLHPDRNLTAGKIYQNTKDLESASQQFVDDARRAEYAEGWIQRWPRA